MNMKACRFGISQPKHITAFHFLRARWLHPSLTCAFKGESTRKAALNLWKSCLAGNKHWAVCKISAFKMRHFCAFERWTGVTKLALLLNIIWEVLVANVLFQTCYQQQYLTSNSFFFWTIRYPDTKVIWLKTKQCLSIYLSIKTHNLLENLIQMY